MNMAQKVAVAAGAVLAAIRMVFPVKYTSILGMRFVPSGANDMFQQVDWETTGLHLGGIALVTAALVLVLNKKDMSF